MYETRAYDKPNTDGFGPDPVVVLVVTGTHDVSRLVNLFSKGNVEQGHVAEELLRQVHRHDGGRAALELLKAHGGPDFTSSEDEVDVPALLAEVERLRELVDDYGLDDETWTPTRRNSGARSSTRTCPRWCPVLENCTCPDGWTSDTCPDHGWADSQRGGKRRGA